MEPEALVAGRDVRKAVGCLNPKFFENLDFAHGEVRGRVLVVLCIRVDRMEIPAGDSRQSAIAESLCYAMQGLAQQLSGSRIQARFP